MNIVLTKDRKINIKKCWLLVYLMAHLALELFGTSEKEEGHVPVPSVVSSSSLLQTFISDLLPLLEVFLYSPACNLSLSFSSQASVHVSVCQPYLPLSPYPPPLSWGDEWCSVARQALQRAGAPYRKVPVINRRGRGERGRMKNESIYGQVMWAT